MSKLQITYDDTQHCTALQRTIRKSVASDACAATGGKGEELSPGELVGTGLASCMLFSMGVVALRDDLDIRGTLVDVDLSLGGDRINSIGIEFVMPQGFSATDRGKLEKAASMCPIKRSFHPDIAISTRFPSAKRATVS